MFEIWGWQDYEEIERIHYKYIRWLLGIRQSTPKYIILEETKRVQLSIAAGKQAINFEEKIRTTPWKELVYDCWHDMLKREGRNIRSEWEQQRTTYYEKKGYSPMYVEMKRTLGQSMKEELVERHKDIALQERREKIETSKSNPRYKKITTSNIPSHLNSEDKNLQIVARFRMGNEEFFYDSWRRKEDRSCRVCNSGEDTFEHLSRDCIPALKNTKSVQAILHDLKPDVSWMKAVMRARKEPQGRTSMTND